MTFLQFALLGLGTGAIYAVMALGLVLTYRASGVLNFAAGAMGAFAAFVYYWLHVEHGMGWGLAAALGVVSGAGLGVLTHVLVMSRLRQSSALTKLIATLGILTALQGVVILIWGSDQTLVTSFLPTAPLTITKGLTISEEPLIILGIVIVLAVALKLLYSRTSFGLATSAVAENRRAAAISGWSTSRIELANWTIGGALAAVAGILVVPIIGLSATEVTLVVIPSLAAALLGRFSSFLVTVGGALLLGILQSDASWYVKVPGFSDSLSFILIIVIVVAGGRARPTRGDLSTTMPLPGSGRVNYRVVALMSALALLLLWTVGATWATAIGETFIFATIILSVVVVTGYCGQLSLGQWALAGLGAWIAARLVDAGHFPFWAAALIGVAGTIPIGVCIAIPALRTRGVNLAVVTLGMSLVIEEMILNNTALTGGLDGTTVGSPTLFGINLDPVSHPARYGTAIIVVFVLLALLVANIRRGRTGRRLLAVRSNERAAASIGVGVYGAKIYAFGLSAAIAGVAGVMVAFQLPVVVFTQFDVFTSISVVMYAVVGGIAWVLGSILGAPLAPGTLIAQFIDAHLSSFSNWLAVIAGLSVILVLVQNPNGVAEINATVVRKHVDRWKQRRGRSPKPRGAVLPVVSGPDRNRTATTLEVKDLSVHFGGVRALQNVSFTAVPGKVLGLIGPNGAGKTTMLDAVTGFVKPTTGTVSANGLDLAGYSPVRRARAGIGRSFQAVELFDGLTVRENLLTAADTQDARRYFVDMVHPGRQARTTLLDDVIRDFQLEDVLDLRPSELSHGTARLVGVARALVAEPTVLFLDEPAAGLDSTETAEFGPMIRRIATERNVAVVLVEHDVPLVLGICDHIVVLDFGICIASGSPDEIRRHPAVISAYLGNDDVPEGSDATVTVQA